MTLIFNSKEFGEIIQKENLDKIVSIKWDFGDDVFNPEFFYFD